jgi:hypothetical protein
VDRIEQLGAGEDAAGLGGQRRQQFELGRGQVDRGAANADLAPWSVELEVADGEVVGRRGLLLGAT